MPVIGEPDLQIVSVGILNHVFMLFAKLDAIDTEGTRINISTELIVDPSHLHWKNRRGMQGFSLLRDTNEYSGVLLK